jgi:protein-S-isoprenylcysteine O-methyltransferase Ste14
MSLKRTPRIIIGFLISLLFLWRARPDTASYLIGALLMVFGESVRFVSAGTLIKFEGVTRSGIYTFTRNPLYIGSFLIGLGACAMGRDPLFAALFLVLFPIVYARVIRREEAWLIGRYGDEYLAYMSEVPRIIPRRLDLAVVMSATSPFLAVKNRELPAVLGLTAVLVFMAVRMVW